MNITVLNRDYCNYILSKFNAIDVYVDGDTRYVSRIIDRTSPRIGIEEFPINRYIMYGIAIFIKKNE